MLTKEVGNRTDDFERPPIVSTPFKLQAGTTDMEKLTSLKTLDEKKLVGLDSKRGIDFGPCQNENKQTLTRKRYLKR